MSGPPNRLRPAFKASTLSLGMRGSTIATTIAHSIDTHGWARISLPGYTNLVLREPDRFFACASASGKNPPTKILRNQGLQKPEIREKLREITRDKIMITKAGKVRVGNHRNPERTSYTGGEPVCEYCIADCSDQAMTDED